MRRTRSNSAAEHISYEKRSLRGSRTGEFDFSESIKPQRRSHHSDIDNYARSSPKRKVARLSSDVENKKDSSSSLKRRQQSLPSRHFTRAAKNNSIHITGTTKTETNGLDVTATPNEKQKFGRIRRKLNSVSEGLGNSVNEVSEHLHTPYRITRNISRRTQSSNESEVAVYKTEPSLGSSPVHPTSKVRDVRDNNYAKQFSLDGLSRALRTNRGKCNDCGKLRTSGDCHCESNSPAKLSSSKHNGNSTKATRLKQEVSHRNTILNSPTEDLENDVHAQMTSENPRSQSATCEIQHKNGAAIENQLAELATQGDVNCAKEEVTKSKDPLAVEEETVACAKLSILDEFRNIEVDYCNVVGEDCIPINHRKRKMNLRSSGVSCNPDYYALSLELLKKSRSKPVNGVSKSIPLDRSSEESSKDIHIGDGDEICEALKDAITNGEKLHTSSVTDGLITPNDVSNVNCMNSTLQIAPCDHEKVNNHQTPENSLSKKDEVVNSSSEFGALESTCDASKKVHNTNNCYEQDVCIEQRHLKPADCEPVTQEQSDTENKLLVPETNKSKNDTNSQALSSHDASINCDDSVVVDEGQDPENKCDLNMSDLSCKADVMDDTVSPNKLSDSPMPRKRRGYNKHKTKETNTGKILQKSPKVHMILRDPSEPPPLFEDEALPKSDVYYFESDHVALKHNRDYQNLLQAVAVLEAQRHQCLHDIETLTQDKSQILTDPVAFVEKLQTKSSKEYCRPQAVQELPEICWSKYSSQYGTFSNVFGNDTPSSSKPVTRKVKLNFESGVPTQSSRKQTNKDINRLSNSLQTSRATWTVEEQLKLEGLLEKYPSEPIEFNRFRKIATELGNRTPLQVQSRVQKYFIKLAKAGLPVPGNKPRINRQDATGTSRNKRARSHPQQGYLRMSTFFPMLHCPVQMNSDDLDLPCSSEQCTSEMDTEDLASDEDDIPEDLRHCPEYIEIRRLKKLRREKLQVLDNRGGQALARHIGFACDICDNDPIQGVRYHCIDCPQDSCVDLCQSCIRFRGQFTTESHKSSHRMEPVYESQNFHDDDYMKFISPSGEYNYLDPNFHPAGI